MSGNHRESNRQIVPFKAKVIEPIRLIPLDERLAVIERAGLNMFNIRAEDVYIDLLTDSGTGSISNAQLAGMMMGDESYAGSRSFHRLAETFQNLTGLPYVLPSHQGRGAEKVLNSVLVKKNRVVPGNSHFDTTKAHIEFAGGRCVDCTIKEGKSSQTMHPFKGNVDLEKLRATIDEFGPKNIAYVLITVTCNSGGGQPVSLENIHAVSELAHGKGVRVYFDAARFAENAYFIKEREAGYEKKTIPQIVREMFDCVDGCTMSSKKDAIVPMGGLVATRDQGLYEALKVPTILFEGFFTYGGMSGLMMEALAQGLEEVVQEDYLVHRISQSRMLGKWLNEVGVPIVEPVGGHAVFIDGRRFFPHVPEDQFPAQLLCVEMYKEGAVRPVEVGSNLIGRDPDNGDNIRPALDLCRLALPRRVYGKEHLEYVVDVADTVRKTEGSRRSGLMFDKELPGIRHFVSTFKYV
ncbi:MAG: tryptophanase [Myxococcota bacterium]|jgi:tryptophanase|nr:tryptophanase [Myxococcota bacterium]